jgi:hypothetical protein
MSMPQTDIPAPDGAPAPATNRKRGRKLGGKNREGHKAGRPRKPPEEFAPSVWEHGRVSISLSQEHIDKSMQRNSSHCAGVSAIRTCIPDATFVSVDLQTVRFSRNGCRYVCLTPHVLQDFVINYDQGNAEAVKPINFTLKPAFISKAGKKRRHAPDPEQLKDVGLRVAKDQPHLSDRASPESVRELVSALTGEPVPEPPDWQERNKAHSTVIANGGEPPEPKSKRKPRQARAKVSAATRGVVPTTLGGRLPPVSVLARREFGLRCLRK